MEGGVSGKHVNLYDAASVLRCAFRCVHQKKVDRDGIQGSTRSMSFTCATAGAFLSHQDYWVDKFFDDMLATEPCICILRSFDGTPWRLRFGCMQEQLAVHARYTLRKKDDTGWEQVSASEFAKRYGGKIGRFGTLEVLAQQLQINYVARKHAPDHTTYDSSTRERLDYLCCSPQVLPADCEG